MPENTTAREDRVVDICHNFGGVADECANVVDSLDTQLSKALNTISNLEDEVQGLQDEIKELQNQ